MALVPPEKTVVTNCPVFVKSRKDIFKYWGIV